MSVMSPYLSVFSPNRISDGEGGFEWNVQPEDWQKIYINVSFHEGETVITTRTETPVKVGTLLRLEGGDYEVTEIRQHEGFTQKRLVIQRLKRPINPA